MMDHLLVLPVLLPLLAAAAMLLVDERQRGVKNVVSVVTVLLLVAVSILLLLQVADPSSQQVFVYQLGNWPAPFGIVLVADRLAVLMVLLTSVIGAAGLIYALSRWALFGPRFHALYLLLLMGVAGAFLTGDLFNLYVFFEVLLAASYGLLLHSSGRQRVKAGLHYLAINLVGSVFFLLGVSLIYGLTGTLNMADLAVRIAELSSADLPLLKAGAAVLGVAFLVKAASWPLNFWLPTTYAAAPAPVAALFAIMTKVGVYVILRLTSLMSAGLNGVGDGPGLAEFGASWLLYAGMATILVGSFGVIASRTLPHTAGYATIVSTGTLLAVLGSSSVEVISGGLYYLVGSTVGIAALFLLADSVTRRERQEAAAKDVGPVFSDDYETALRSEFEGVELGSPIPAATALLGGSFFLITLLLVGMPPLSGFIAKFAILDGVLKASPGGSNLDAGTALIGDASLFNGSPVSAWLLLGLIVFSGFATLLALLRQGIHVFWKRHEQAASLSLRTAEAVSVSLLVSVALALTLFAGPIMRFTDATSAYLLTPETYVNALFAGASPVDAEESSAQVEQGPVTQALPAAVIPTTVRPTPAVERAGAAGEGP